MDFDESHITSSTTIEFQTEKDMLPTNQETFDTANTGWTELYYWQQ